MWVYNNIPFMCEPIDILYKVRDHARANGINMLKDIKPTTNAIMVTCPWHKNGQESKPSCGLITKQKSKDALPVGKVHCFRCGHIASLEEFISNVFGIYDGGTYGSKFLASNFIQIELGNRPELDLSKTMSRGQIIQPNNKFVSDLELDRFRFTHPYMYHRKMTDQTIEIFDVGYDPKFILDETNPKCYPIECITFPVRDINGNCLFIARRAINSKLFHYPDSATKPIYGLYELRKYAPPNINEIYICESMINAITIWSYGKYAIALNGTGSQTQLQQLAKLPYRKFILALDPDEAGILGCQKIYNAVKRSKMCLRVQIPKGKDINDLSYEEFHSLPQFFMSERLNI